MTTTLAERPRGESRTPAQEPRTCARCVLTDRFPGIAFDAEGVCSVCREYEREWQGWEAGLPAKEEILAGFCRDARRQGRTFDALVPLSGGKDSMYVLYLAVKKLGLRCLAFTMDNGYLTPHARENIDRACRLLGVEHVYYCLDPALLNRLFALFMRKTGYFCSVCMRAIGMATELVAGMHDVPLVLSGSCRRTELVLAPEMFQPGPPEYVRNVLAGEPLAREARRYLFAGSLKRRLGYRWFWWGAGRRLRSYAWVNLPDYVEWNYETIYRVLREELGWTNPPGHLEHTDCAIHPITTLMHDRRFQGLEIRRLTLARLVQAGQIGREEALRRLAEDPPDKCPEELLASFAGDLGMTREEFLALVDRAPRHLGFRPGETRAWRLLRAAKRAVFRLLRIRRAV